MVAGVDATIETEEIRFHANFAEPLFRLHKDAWLLQQSCFRALQDKGFAPSDFRLETPNILVGNCLRQRVLFRVDEMRLEIVCSDAVGLVYDELEAIAVVLAEAVQGFVGLEWRLESFLISVTSRWQVTLAQSNPLEIFPVVFTPLREMLRFDSELVGAGLAFTYGPVGPRRLCCR